MNNSFSGLVQHDVYLAPTFYSSWVLCEIDAFLGPICIVLAVTKAMQSFLNWLIVFLLFFSDGELLPGKKDRKL